MSFPICHFRYSIFSLETLKFEQLCSQNLELNQTCAIAPKFSSPIQTNIGPNFSNRLNFVKCEHSLICLLSIKIDIFCQGENHYVREPMKITL